MSVTRLPRNVAKLPAAHRAEFVAQFVGQRVELLAQRGYGSPETFTGHAIALALDYARPVCVLAFQPDSGVAMTFTMPVIRNIERAPVAVREASEQ